MNAAQEPSHPTREIYSCSACLRLDDVKRVVCPSCSSINTFQIADPKWAVHFRKVERFISASSISTVGSADRNSSPMGMGNDREELRPYEQVQDLEQDPEARAAADDDEEGDDLDENENGDDEEEEKPRAQAASLSKVNSFRSKGIIRLPSGDAGVDHVFGGGIPAHQCFMLTAHPGGGKSTLARRLACAMAELGLRTMLACGEEAGDITDGEFKRCGLYKDYPKGSRRVEFSGSDDIDENISAAQDNDIEVLFVDSVSVMTSKFVEGEAGDTNQVNYCAKALMHASHAMGEYKGYKPMTVIMIVHATKDGKMAGPNRAKHWTDGSFILEHINPHTLEVVDDPNEPTGYVRLRIYGKYRRGSPIARSYYHFTDKGLEPWKPGDPIEDPPDVRPSTPAARRPRTSRTARPATEARTPNRKPSPKKPRRAPPPRSRKSSRKAPPPRQG